MGFGGRLGLAFRRSGVESRQTPNNVSRRSRVITLKDTVCEHAPL